MRSELNYAGKNLSEFGMWFDNSKVYKKPSKRFMGYDIPARNGTLYQSENKFNNVIIEFDCFIKDNFDQNYNDLVNFLNSFETYQKLVNSYNPNMFRMALFHEAIEVDTGQFLKDGRFKLFFDCKPQEYYADGAEFEQIASHYDTYTGDPAVLVNEGESTVTNLKVALEPIQTGTGDPSPTNIRPISGHSSVTVEVTDNITTDTHSASLGQSVYGGTVDLITGVLTIDKGYKTVTASDSVQTVGSGGHGWQVLRTSFDDPPVNTGANYSDGVYCDRLKSEVGASSVADDLCFINSSGVLRFNTTTVYADKTALFNALGQINVAYPIEPQTYSLTPQTIDLLIGNNYISSSGEVTVTTKTPLTLKNPSPRKAKPVFKFTNITAPFTVEANGETIISFQNAISLIKHAVANNMTFDANGTTLTVTKTGTPAYTETSILINSGYLPAGRYSFSSASLGSLEVRSADGTQTYSSGGPFTLTDITQVKIWYVITPSASTPQTFSMPIHLRPLGTLYVNSELMDCYMLDGDTAYTFNECVELPKDFLELDDRTVITMTNGATGYIAPNWWRL